MGEYGGVMRVVLVPGCRVSGDGRASPGLERRVRAAVRVWGEERGGEGVVVVCSGAGGEAEAAAEILRAAGVPAGAIRLERRARTTEENARFSAELLREEGVEPGAVRAVVCSDRWHLARCVYVCGLHFGEVGGVAVDGPVRWQTLLREVMARWVYRWRYRGGRGQDRLQSGG